MSSSRSDTTDPFQSLRRKWDHLRREKTDKMRGNLWGSFEDPRREVYNDFMYMQSPNINLLFSYSCEEPIPLFSVSDPSLQTKPFIHRTVMSGPEHLPTMLYATADGGAMMNAIDLTTWASIAHRLGSLSPSRTKARMANGAIVPSKGRWIGSVQMAALRAVGGFEVIDSGGAFEVLLGKPWLGAAGVAHDFEKDVLRAKRPNGEHVEVENEVKGRIEREREGIVVAECIPEMLGEDWEDEKKRILGMIGGARNDEIERIPEKLEKEKAQEAEYWEQEDERERGLLQRELYAIWLAHERTWGGEKGVSEEEWDEVMGWLQTALDEDMLQIPEVLDAEVMNEAVQWNEREIAWGRHDAKERAFLQKELTDIWVLHQAGYEDGIRRADTVPSKPVPKTMKLPQSKSPSVIDIFMVAKTLSENSKVVDRFAPERVQRVLKALKIGDDLSGEQREAVVNLVREFADVFALSLTEIQPVEFIQHALNLPPGIKGPRHAHQKQLTEPQLEWLYGILDDMEKASIIKKVPTAAAKWVSAMSLAPKEKPGAGGLSLDDLRRRANEECVKEGFAPMWEELDAAGVPVAQPAERVDKGGDDGAESAGKREEAKRWNKWRLCMNFIGLNKVTPHHSFPMGDLGAKQQMVAGHRWVSVIDFMAGFYAVGMADDDIGYTAFEVPGRGMYVFLRMPLGLTGSPNTFQEMVSTAFGDMVGRDMIPWVDDCALWGDEFDEKFSKLRRFFTRCRERKLSLSPSKTNLFMSEALFAGAVVSAAGVAPDLSKVSALLDWEQPKTALELMGFLGLTGHFRHLIPDYARRARPLSDLTRNVKTPSPKGAKVPRGAFKRALTRESIENRWGDSEKEAFVWLKTILTSAPILRSPQFDRPFIVTTDGSKYGFGATLSQMWQVLDSKGVTKSVECPVAYASKRTSGPEERYAPFLLEFAALRFALNKFDKMIYGQPLHIITDCQALRDILNRDDLSSTYARWKDSVISRNIIDIQHRAGVENQADGLSRKWGGGERTVGEGEDWDVEPDWESEKGVVNDMFVLLEGGEVLREVKEKFAEDPYFKDIAAWLTALGTPGLSEAESRRARRRALDFMVDDGKLWRVGGRNSHRSSRVQCVPTSEGLDLAKRCHADGHFGRDLCEAKLQTEYFWPKMRRDVVEAIQECSTCKAFGARHIHTLLQPLTRSRPFQMITGDYLSLPVGKGKFKTVLLMVDVFTRYVWGSKTTKAGTGAFTVDSLRHLKQQFATPELFATDGGTHFDCKEVRDWCAEAGVEYSKTPPYSPWANGLVEDCNKILIGRLRRLCNPDFDDDDTTETAAESALKVPSNWPLYFDLALEQMNSRILPSLTYSPRELLFGMALTDRPGDSSTGVGPASDVSAIAHLAFVDALRSDGWARSIDHATTRKRHFDKKVKAIDFLVGDIVQVYDDRLDKNYKLDNKLAARWSGPMQINTKLLNSYEVNALGYSDGGIYVHGRRMRRWVPNKGTALEQLEKERLIRLDQKARVEEVEDEGEPRAGV